MKPTEFLKQLTDENHIEGSFDVADKFFAHYKLTLGKYRVLDGRDESDNHTKRQYVYADGKRVGHVDCSVIPGPDCYWTEFTSAKGTFTLAHSY